MRPFGLVEMAQARLPWTSTTIQDWYGGPGTRWRLSRGLEVEAARIADASFGQAFRDLVGRTSLPAEPLVWANRVHDLDDGGWAVAGIRFRRLHPDKPFVDIIATTAPPTVDGLSEVARAVLPEYAEFAPLTLRVDAPEPDALVVTLRADPRFRRNAAVDQYVVAGRVSDLHAGAVAVDAGLVALRPAAAAHLADRVAAIYAERATCEPVSRDWAQPEDDESLNACADQGLLLEVFFGSTPAGAVAALRDDAHAMSGFAVQELCLDRAHRGRRLAATVLQQLVTQLPAQPGDVLWGTIHPDNAPSLRNALSVGRQVVGGYVWVVPDGLPGMPMAPTPH